MTAVAVVSYYRHLNTDADWLWRVQGRSLQELKKASLVVDISVFCTTASAWARVEVFYFVLLTQTDIEAIQKLLNIGRLLDRLGSLLGLIVGSRQTKSARYSGNYTVKSIKRAWWMLVAQLLYKFVLKFICRDIIRLFFDNEIRPYTSQRKKWQFCYWQIREQDTDKHLVNISCSTNKPIYT